MASQVINVIVNSKGAVTVVKQLNQMGDAARQTTTYLNSLRAILSAALTFSGVSAIIDVVDSLTSLQNRLKQVADEQNTVASSWEKLMVIANNSYSTIDSTVDLYFRVAQAYKAWGESADKAFKFTDLFQKAAILSGSSMQTTSQAVYQFGQALNKGKLDGDEFRSVLEGLPYVATLIQKSLGVTRAELYKLSRDGKISVDQIKDAFESAADAINGDFSKITPTIGMALTVLKNNWIDFVSDVQSSTGIFSILAQVILVVADHFGLLAAILAPVAAAFVYMAGRLAVGLVVIAFRDLTDSIKVLLPWITSLNAAMLLNPWVLAAVAITAVVAAIIYFRNELGLTNEVLTAMWQVLTSTFTTVWTVIMTVASGIATVVVKLYEWTSLWPALVKGAITFGKGVADVFMNLLDIVASSAAFMVKTFTPVWRELVALAQNWWDLISDIAAFITDVFGAAIAALEPTWNKVWGVIEPALMKLMKFLKDIYDGWVLIGNWLRDHFGNILTQVFEGWALILSGILKWINKIIDALQAAIALMRTVAGIGGGGGTAPAAHNGAQFTAGQGYAGGGQFKVGGTNSGRDTTPVAFRAERGERVTVETKKQQRANDNSQGQTDVKVPISIMNVFDPSMVPTANESASGQRSIINVIAANRDEILATLGVG